jgi:hypothetical protein
MAKKRKKTTRRKAVKPVKKRIVADPFCPHSFETRQVSLRHLAEPKIFITPEAYADMLAIAGNSGADEIGWLGTVTELGGGKYLIDGIFLPAQVVHEATCELTEDGIGELFTELAVSDFEACEKMQFWGHVHPGNSTTPSPQDEEQMDQFSHNDWFIRGIFGRHGRAEFTFFDYRNGVRWNDVPWTIHCPVSEKLRAKWRAEVEAKVERIAVITPHLNNLSQNRKNFSDDDLEIWEGGYDNSHR